MRLLLTLLPAALCPTGATGQPRPIRIADRITVHRLAPNVWLYTATAPIEGYGDVPSNGVIVAKEGEALLLDTPTTDAQTAELAAWIERELHARITQFVPNHWHSDCMGGLNWLHARGVRSYAQERTVRIARREGKPVPRTAFADSLRLDVHGIEAVCCYLGGGHSEDNIVVWLPEQRILFAGCMVKEAAAQHIGNTSDAAMDEWPATLRRLSERFPDARIVVPGHGRTGGPELILHTLKIVEAFRAGPDRPAAER